MAKTLLSLSLPLKVSRKRVAPAEQLPASAHELHAVVPERRASRGHTAFCGVFQRDSAAGPARLAVLGFMRLEVPAELLGAADDAVAFRALRLEAVGSARG